MYLLKLSIAQTLSAYFPEMESAGIAKDALENGFSSYEELEKELEAIMEGSGDLTLPAFANRLARRCIEDLKDNNLQMMTTLKGRNISLYVK